MELESRKAFRQRLQKEQRWAEYVRWEDKLRKAGTPKDQIRKLAAAQWPPLEQGGDPAPDPPDDEADSADEDDDKPTPTVNNTLELPELQVADFIEKKRADEREIVQWIFDHMFVTDVTPDMAPSAGAWGYLLFLRSSPSSRDTFFNTIWPKTLPTRSQLENLDKQRDNAAPLQQLIRQVLEVSREDG